MPATGGSRPATISDVARLAGVSVSTVSYRLSGTRPISEATADRIDEAVSALNYAPNSRARSLRRRRSDSIGLVLPDPQNPFFMELAAGLESALRPHGVCVVLCPTGFEEAGERHYAGLLTSRQIDGVVLVSGTGRFADALGDFASQRRIVLVDESIPGLDVPLITADNQAGAKALATHAMALGHHDVGIIAGPENLWSTDERLTGMVEALAACGSLEPRWLVNAPYTIEGGLDAARAMLSGEQRPSLVMAANDLQALGVYTVCRELGIGIGTDISITGFDDIPIAGLLSPGLATVRQPAFEMGALAARILLDQIADDTRHVDSPAPLCTQTVVRDSLNSPVGA